jgi:hypothetical protein
LCPVGASARPPRCLPGTRGRRRTGFRSIPAFSRANDADEELAPRPLKEQGNRSLRCETDSGGACRQGHLAEYRRLRSIAAALNVAVHYGLKSMFEAQQVRSVRHRSVHATRARRRDVIRAPSECSIRYHHRQTGSAPDSSPFRHGVRGRPAFMRFANGQQDAHRRDPSGRNPGGRPARQSCRRV